jgi:peroxiredoxin
MLVLALTHPNEIVANPGATAPRNHGKTIASSGVVLLADVRSEEAGDAGKLVHEGEKPRPWKKGPTGTDVGKVALDITGEDIDGKKLRLSDHGGKVILLSFWGNWCPPCRATYDRQRTLAAKLTRRPFVLIGVNSDGDRDSLKKVVADEKLTWRSFWNSGSTNGPISRDWKVNGWPTLVLIDHEGVIRQRWVGAPRPGVLEQAIDDLLKEAGGRNAR